jgi:hypothetical protein
MKGKRKVVQLTGFSDFGILALCDDGTIWRLNYNSGGWQGWPLPPGCEPPPDDEAPDAPD